jgi:hypothetical protein
MTRLGRVFRQWFLACGRWLVVSKFESFVVLYSVVAVSLVLARQMIEEPVILCGSHVNSKITHMQTFRIMEACTQFEQGSSTPVPLV